MSAIADPSDRTLARRAKRMLRRVCPRALLMWREASYFRRFGEVELGIVRLLCRPNSDSVDIGANEGSYIHFMRRYSRHVHAFEPVPWLADLLASKFPKGVTVHGIALSDTSGTAVLQIPIAAGGVVTGLASLNPRAVADYPESRRIEVPMAPFDAVYSGTVGFIKIDVEGHEEAVLDGARKTVERYHPRLLVEIEERMSPGAVDRIARTLGRLGYHGYFIRGQELEPIEHFDARSMQRPEDIAGFGAGVPRRHFAGYINNFLFFPSDDPETTLPQIQARLRRV